MNEHSNRTRKLDHLTICIHIPQMDQLNQALANLSVVDDHFNIEQLHITVEIGGQSNPVEIQTQLTEVLKHLKELKVTEQEVTDLLNKIDSTTNKTAANIQTIADVDQKISDEIDAFLAAAPAGTVLTDAMAAQLQTIADRAQATSDAADAQVSVLQAIAAKGAPVVPPPPPPPPVA